MAMVSANEKVIIELIVLSNGARVQLWIWVVF